MLTVKCGFLIKSMIFQCRRKSTLYKNRVLFAKVKDKIWLTEIIVLKVMQPGIPIRQWEYKLSTHTLLKCTWRTPSFFSYLSFTYLIVIETICWFNDRAFPFAWKIKLLMCVRQLKRVKSDGNNFFFAFNVTKTNRAKAWSIYVNKSCTRNEDHDRN